MDRFFKLGSVTFSDSVSGYTKSIVVRGRGKINRGGENDNRRGQARRENRRGTKQRGREG